MCCRAIIGYLESVPPCSLLAAQRIEAQLDSFVQLRGALLTEGQVEDVHKCRVAARRSRSAVRFFRPWLPEQARAWSDECRWLAERLGAVRDFDVMMGLLADSGFEPPVLLDRLELRRRRASRNLHHALSSTKFDHLVKNGQALVEETESEKRGHSKQALRRLGKLGGEGTELLLAAMASEHGPDWHQFRIEIKRIRYAVESLTPLDPKGCKKSLKRLAELQEVLGSFQDACMLHALLLVEGFADEAGSAEWVTSRQATLAKTVPSQWRAVTDSLLRIDD